MESKTPFDAASETSVPITPTRDTYPTPQPSFFRTGNTLGVLHHVLLPNLNLHASLSLVAYTAGRLTQRVDSKDFLWPSAQVLNAWYNGVIYPAFKYNVSLTTSFRSLSWTQKLLLGGVTAWGSRLFYRIAKRSIQRGRDDPRYAELSHDANFWNKAFFAVFLPEAVFQSLISLAWTIPLTAPGACIGPASEAGVAPLLHSTAVGLYCTGLGLEVMADVQLAKHTEVGNSDLNTSGVWSIVRHPNYLGDALTHLSLPLLLYSDSLFHPLTLLGPLSNYLFLRFVGGDRENEAAQEARYKIQNTKKYAQLEKYRGEKNSFWPALVELGNPWTWAVVGVGALGVVGERALRSYSR